MIDISTGKNMTRGGFLKGILATGVAPSIVALAGSANASVGGMMRNKGAQLSTIFGGVDMTDKQLADDLKKMMNATIEVIDWDFPITLNRIAGSRPFFGQINLKSLTLRNCVIGIFNGSYFLDGLNADVFRYLRVDLLTSIPNSFGGNCMSGCTMLVTPSLDPNEKCGNGIYYFSGTWDVRPKNCSDVLAMINGYHFSSNHPNTTVVFLCSDGTVTHNGTEWVANLNA